MYMSSPSSSSSSPSSSLAPSSSSYATSTGTSSNNHKTAATASSSSTNRKKHKPSNPLKNPYPFESNRNHYSMAHKKNGNLTNTATSANKTANANVIDVNAVFNNEDAKKKLKNYKIPKNNSSKNKSNTNNNSSSITCNKQSSESGSLTLNDVDFSNSNRISSASTNNSFSSASSNRNNWLNGGLQTQSTSAPSNNTNTSNSATNETNIKQETKDQCNADASKIQLVQIQYQWEDELEKKVQELSDVKQEYQHFRKYRKYYRKSSDSEKVTINWFREHYPNRPNGKLSGSSELRCQASTSASLEKRRVYHQKLGIEDGLNEDLPCTSSSSNTVNSWSYLHASSSTSPRSEQQLKFSLHQYDDSDDEEDKKEELLVIAPTKKINKKINPSTVDCPWQMISHEDTFEAFSNQNNNTDGDEEENVEGYFVTTFPKLKPFMVKSGTEGDEEIPESTSIIHCSYEHAQSSSTTKKSKNQNRKSLSYKKKKSKNSRKNNKYSNTNTKNNTTTVTESSYLSTLSTSQHDLVAKNNDQQQQQVQQYAFSMEKFKKLESFVKTHFFNIDERNYESLRLYLQSFSVHVDSNFLLKIVRDVGSMYKQSNIPRIQYEPPPEEQDSDSDSEPRPLPAKRIRKSSTKAIEYDILQQSRRHQRNSSISNNNFMLMNGMAIYDGPRSSQSIKSPSGSPRQSPSQHQQFYMNQTDMPVMTRKQKKDYQGIFINGDANMCAPLSPSSTVFKNVQQLQEYLMKPIASMNSLTELSIDIRQRQQLLVMLKKLTQFYNRFNPSNHQQHILPSSSNNSVSPSFSGKRKKRRSQRVQDKSSTSNMSSKSTSRSTANVCHCDGGMSGCSPDYYRRFEFPSVDLIKQIPPYDKTPKPDDGVLAEPYTDYYPTLELLEEAEKIARPASFFGVSVPSSCHENISPSKYETRLRSRSSSNSAMTGASPPTTSLSLSSCTPTSHIPIASSSITNSSIEPFSSTFSIKNEPLDDEGDNDQDDEDNGDHDNDELIIYHLTNKPSYDEMQTKFLAMMIRLCGGYINRISLGNNCIIERVYQITKRDHQMNQLESQLDYINFQVVDFHHQFLYFNKRFPTDEKFDRCLKILRFHDTYSKTFMENTVKTMAMIPFSQNYVWDNAEMKDLLKNDRRKFSANKHDDTADKSNKNQDAMNNVPSFCKDLFYHIMSNLINRRQANSHSINPNNTDDNKQELIDDLINAAHALNWNRLDSEG